MSAVNLWKAKKLQSHTWFAEAHCKWRFVRIAENNALAEQPAMNPKIRSATVNRFSARYSKALHKERSVILGETEGTRSAAHLQKGQANAAKKESQVWEKREGENIQRATAAHPSNV